MLKKNIVFLIVAILHLTILLGQINERYEGGIFEFNEEIIWRYPVGYRFSTPIIQDGVIYFGDFIGHIYAVYENNGQERWVIDTGDEDILSTPIIDNDILYIESDKGFIYAIDTKKGSIIWRYVINGSVYTVANKSILYFASKNTIYAIDGRKGKEIWKTELQSNIYTSPVVDGKTLFVGDNGGMFYSINIKNGKINWTYNTLKEMKITIPGTDDYYIWKYGSFGTPAILYKEYVIFGSEMDDSMTFFVLNRKDGKLIWKRNVEAYQSKGAPIAVIDGNIILNTQGILLSVDIIQNSINWQVWEDFHPSSKIFNGLWYHVGEWYIEFQNLKDGEYLDCDVNFNRKGVGGIMTNAVISNGSIIFGANNGNLYLMK